MGSRKETPDILGELLGGNNRPLSSGSQATLFKKPQDAPKSVAEAGVSSSEIKPDKTPEDADSKLGENLLISAANKIQTAEKFLGRERLLAWLREMQHTFGLEDAAADKRPPEATLENRVVEWTARHFKAVGSRIDYRANGLNVTKPYKVDVWTHLKGERYRPDLDVWIDCRYENDPVTEKDITDIVSKGTDIYHAAHTDKQDFWFDRLMFVSMAPFSKEVLELADEYGVVCVFYDRTSFIIQTDPYWKLKPRWLKDAEEDQSKTNA